MKQQHFSTPYESPLVLVGAFKAEQGFAQSPTSNYGLKHISGDDVQNESDDWDY